MKAGGLLTIPGLVSETFNSRNSQTNARVQQTFVGCESIDTGCGMLEILRAGNG